MRPLISLCHATARLPHGWKPAAQEWLDKCADPKNVEHVIVTDEWVSIDPIFPITRTAVNTKRRCAVDAWNRSSEIATGKLLITLSDDWFPPARWDKHLLDAIPNLDGLHVVDVDNQDSAYPLLPFSILTRAYLERLIRDLSYSGFFHADYLGMMADCEFTDIARFDKVVIDARDLKFLHLNPDTASNSKNSGTADWDEVYRWQRRDEAMDLGRDVYKRRLKELGIRPGFMPVEAVAC